MADGLDVLVRHLAARHERRSRPALDRIAHVWALTPARVPVLGAGALRPALAPGLPRGCLAGVGRLWRPLAMRAGGPVDAGALARILRDGFLGLELPPEIADSPLMHPWTGDGPGPGDGADGLVEPEYLEPCRSALRGFVAGDLALFEGRALVRVPPPRIDGRGWGFPSFSPRDRDAPFDRTGVAFAAAHARYVGRVDGADRAASVLRESAGWGATWERGGAVPLDPCGLWLVRSAGELAREAWRGLARAWRAGAAEVPGVSPGRVGALARALALSGVHALPPADVADVVEDAHATLAALSDASPRAAARHAAAVAYVEEVARPAAREPVPGADVEAMGGLAP